MISRLGLSIRSIKSGVIPLVADAPVYCRTLGFEVPSGALIGTMDKTEATSVEGPSFSFTMEGRILRSGETDSNKGQIFGEPDLVLSNDRVPTRFITCSTLVNRTLDVIRAPPGLLSLDKLGSPAFRPRLVVNAADENTSKHI